MKLHAWAARLAAVAVLASLAGVTAEAQNLILRFEVPGVRVAAPGGGATPIDPLAPVLDESELAAIGYVRTDWRGRITYTDTDSADADLTIELSGTWTPDGGSAVALTATEITTSTAFHAGPAGGLTLTRSGGQLNLSGGVDAEGSYDLVLGITDEASRTASVTLRLDALPLPVLTTPVREGAMLGYSVAFAGDQIVAGAHAADHGAGLKSYHGAVQVYARVDSTWTQVQEILPPDDTAYFGERMSVHGDTMIVGARASEDYGRAFYATRDGGGVWAIQGRLWQTDIPFSGHGSSTAIEGTRVVVGNVGDDDPMGGGGVNNSAGAAYAYNLGDCTGTAPDRNCQPFAKMVAPTRHQDAHFGGSTALANDIAVIGAWGHGTGEVFAFDLSACTGTAPVMDCPLIATITSTTSQNGDRFGTSLAWDGTWLLVGAPHHPLDASGGSYAYRAGAVHVFEFTGGSFVERAKLVPGDRGASTDFGSSVALAGSRALVGAMWSDVGGFTSAGMADLFELQGGTWQHRAHVPPLHLHAGIAFGTSTALNADNLLIGASRYPFTADPVEPATTNAGGIFVVPMP